MHYRYILRYYNQKVILILLTKVLGLKLPLEAQMTLVNGTILAIMLK